MKAILRGGFAAAVVLAAVVAAPGQATAAPCAWGATVLPLPSDAKDGGVNAADGDGWFAGWTASGGPFDPQPGAIWRGDEVVPIGLALDLPTNIHGVSPSGVVVGAMLEAGFQPSAVVYRDGKWHRLPESGTSSWAYDVNAAGDAVGFDVNEDPERRFENLTIWPHSEFSAPRVLPAPKDAFRMDPPPRIDDDGTVVATYGRLVGTTVTLEGYVWTSGAVEPTQLAPHKEADSVLVRDIRNGHLVGESLGDGGVTGVEWDAGGRIVRTFPIRPIAVNSSGLVLGRTIADDVPVVWGRDDTAEPVKAPEEFPNAWPNGIADETVGGHAFNDSGDTVPVRWQRLCWGEG